MKIRMGFVSNSSSSSFVIGIVEIPESKLEEALEVFGKNNISHASELLTNNWYYNKKEDRAYVDSFNYDTVSSERGITLRNNYFAILDACGYEPEWDEDSWEYNYDDIDLSDDWFNGTVLRRAHYIMDNGGQVTWGGGFNG